MHAPIKAPEILDIIFFVKCFDNSPINITAPQVNKVISWKPKNKSVITKLTINAGRYLIPRRAGT